MSVATSLRSFLVAMPGSTIAQVAQQHIPEGYNPDAGFIWFARRGTESNRTFSQSVGPPEQQFFDIEIYDFDITKVESVADLLQGYDGYRGTFGAGEIQGLFIDTQSDDYEPRVLMTDTENMSSSFLSLEVRSYKE